MKLLGRDERCLVGQRIVNGRQVEKDDVWRRIDWLLANVLERVGASADSGGWDVLYRDPNDNRHWELSYPDGSHHGGGPPMLRLISSDEVMKRYGSF